MTKKTKQTTKPAAPAFTTKYLDQVRNDLAVQFRGFIQNAQPEEILFLYGVMTRWEQMCDAEAESEILIATAFAEVLDQAHYFKVGEFEADAVRAFLKWLLQMREEARSLRFSIGAAAKGPESQAAA